MYRKAIDRILEWKNIKDKKPLVIVGARKTGKTWLMKEVAQTQYKNFAYINFDDNEAIKTLFLGDIDIKNILAELQAETACIIKPEETLIIFDEIQQCPEILHVLKLFDENAPEYDIICASSRVIKPFCKDDFLPEIIELHPLSFPEFLQAMGEDKLLKHINEHNLARIKSLKSNYTQLLRQYIFVGGMPEVVENFAKNRDYKRVRKIQKDILLSYERGFSELRTIPAVSKIRTLWNYLPSQLKKENKKFMYGGIKHGSKAKEYENVLKWLCDSMLVHLVTRIEKPNLPIKEFEDSGAFKLFVLDVGLLGAMLGVNARILLEGNRIFEEFNAGLTQQYVLQQLKSVEGSLVFYWTSKSNTSEIDFVLQNDRDEQNIIPIEVQSALNSKAKNLKSYIDRFDPEVAIRTSLSDFRENNGLYDIPLYVIEMFTLI